MKDVIIATFLNVGTVMTILFLLRYVFGAELNLNLKKMAVIAGVYCVFNFLIQVFVPDLLFWVTWIYIIVVYIMFAPKRRWMIAVYLLPLLLIYNSLSIYMHLVDLTFGTGDIFYVWSDVLMLIPLVIWALWLEKVRFEFTMKWWEVLLLCFYSFASSFYLDVSNMLLSGQMPGRTAWAYSLLWLIFVTIIDLAVFGLVVFRKYHAYTKQLSGLYQKYYEDEYRARQIKSQHQHELDRMRHDWKNHVNTVSAMWEKGEERQAVQYVAGLAQEGINHSNTILSGNEVADAILNLKYDTAKAAGIDFTFKGDLTNLSYMEPVDVCVLLGNALDNAIEACGKEEKESNIAVTATENAGMLLLTIENSLHAPIVLKDNRPITTKMNPSEHGFGVLGMEHVARKYQGDLRFEIVGERFKMQVMLPVRKK